MNSKLCSRNVFVIFLVANQMDLDVGGYGIWSISVGGGGIVVGGSGGDIVVSGSGGGIVVDDSGGGIVIGGSGGGIFLPHCKKRLRDSIKLIYHQEQGNY